MNIGSLYPVLLFQGDIYWLAWDRNGLPIFALPKTIDYLIIQGRLENSGYYDVPSNSKLANEIRAAVERRQHNW